MAIVVRSSAVVAGGGGGGYVHYLHCWCLLNSAFALALALVLALALALALTLALALSLGCRSSLVCSLLDRSTLPLGRRSEEVGGSFADILSTVL